MVARGFIEAIAGSSCVANIALSPAKFYIAEGIWAIYFFYLVST
jgi:hypothetical protein